MPTPPTSPKIFFSYATVARMGEPAYEASKQFLEEFYRVGPPEVLYKYDPLTQEMAAEAAKLINCDPGEVTYVKNTTEGIFIASEALPLEPGDEILVQATEYPANFLPWLKKRKDGLTVTVITAADNATSFEQLLEAISSRTKAIAISSIQSYDGYMADLGRLSAVCREMGIFLAVDAAQHVGVRRIDLKATPVDFLLCGGQKYLRAGTGSGLMYVNKDLLPRLRDIKVGIRGMERFDSNSYTLKPTADRFLDGTQNLVGIVALHAALKHVNAIGMDVIEAKNLELLHDAKDILREAGIDFIDHGDAQGNIVSMIVADPKELCDYLYGRGIYIRWLRDAARLSFIHESRVEDLRQLADLTSQWLKSNS